MPKDLLKDQVSNTEYAYDINAEIEPIQVLLERLEQQIEGLGKTDTEKAGLLLELATLYLEFQRHKDAWDTAWQAFEYFKLAEDWEQAVVACDILMAAEQPDSIKALAHGIWLGISYPINPETTVAILQHLIDESPPGSETQAVAAVTAHYIADIRKIPGKEGDNLLFFTNQRLAEVAAKHRNIANQQEFDIWRTGNEFDNPDSFLPKLSQAVEAMVKDKWWIDRDKLRDNMPD